VIRVTGDNLGVTHETYAGSRVTFYLPPTIEGVDLDAITRDFQVVDFSRFSARGGSATSATAGWLAFSGNFGHCGQVVFNS